MASKAGMKAKFRIVGQDGVGGGAADDATAKRPPISLRDLRRMSAAQLERCYRSAEVTSGVSDLDGPLSGVLLTLGGPLSEGVARGVTNRIAGWDRFPWAGKTFQSWADDRGSGINRVRLLGERLWFHFETHVDRSVVDGGPCILLDYDHAENPWPIRQIRDELREVAPGLWFGPATVRGRTVLYFAVHTP